MHCVSIFFSFFFLFLFFLFNIEKAISDSMELELANVNIEAKSDDITRDEDNTKSSTLVKSNELENPFLSTIQIAKINRRRSTSVGGLAPRIPAHTLKIPQPHHHSRLRSNSAGAKPGLLSTSHPSNVIKNGGSRS